MVMSTAPQPANLSLADRLKPNVSPFEEYLRQYDVALRVAAPGIIETFNPATQTATVLVAVMDRVNIYSSGPNGSIETAQREKMLPVLVDVPVLFPRAGGFAVTFPVSPGNPCVLLFQDSCFDQHWQNGGIQSTNYITRRHDLADAVAILADITQPDVLPNVSTNSMQMRSDDGATFIDVADHAITIQAATLTLNGTQINVAGSSGVSLMGSAVTVAGSTRVTINGDDNTTIDGKPFLLHAHKGVSTGAGVSGPVL